MNSYIKALLFILNPIFIICNQLFFYLFEKRLKFNRNDFFVFLILIYTILYIHLKGRDYFSLTGISLLYAYFLAFSRITMLTYLYFINKNDLKAVIYLLLFWILGSFFYTHFFLNHLVFYRKVNLLFTGSIYNSPNYINISIILCCILIYLRDKYLLYILFFALYISFIFNNRTGLIFFSFYIVFELIIQKKFTLTSIIIFLSFFFINNILSLTRFQNEGLTSKRWLIQYFTLNSWLNRKFIDGGYKIYVGDSIWAHNIILDTYRLTGFYFPFLVFVLIIVSFFFTFKSNNLEFRLLLWITGFFISFTSVVIEGSNFEFVFILFSLFNYLFLDRKLQ